MEPPKTQNIKSNLDKKEQSWRNQTTSDIKLYSKAIVINTVIQV